MGVALLSIVPVLDLVRALVSSILPPRDWEGLTQAIVDTAVVAPVPGKTPREPSVEEKRAQYVALNFVRRGGGCIGVHRGYMGTHRGYIGGASGVHRGRW